MARRGVAPQHRQQFCDAAHHGYLRADPVEASGADAVPAQERSLSDRIQRGREHMTDDLRAAVAAGVLGSEQSYRNLLQSIVEVARAILTARASSILLLDEQADELVFEAVAGEGSDALVGMRLPSSTGIAGWVLVTRQPIVLDDVQSDPRFSHETAAKTGYVPKGLMAVPLLFEEQSLGVLQVLDRPERSRFSLQEMELLGLFA